MRTLSLTFLLLALTAPLAAQDDDAAATARGAALLERLAAQGPQEPRTLRLSVFLAKKWAGVRTYEVKPTPTGYELNSLDEIALPALSLKVNAAQSATCEKSFSVLRWRATSEETMGSNTNTTFFERVREGDHFLQQAAPQAPKLKSGPVSGVMIPPSLTWQLFVPLIDLSKPGNLLLPGLPSFASEGKQGRLAIRVRAESVFEVRGQQVKGHQIDIAEPYQPSFSVVVSPKGSPLLLWQGSPEKPGEPLLVGGTPEQLAADKAPVVKTPAEQAVEGVFGEALKFMSGNMPEGEVDSLFDWKALHASAPQRAASPEELRKKTLARASTRPLPPQTIQSLRVMAVIKVSGQSATVSVGQRPFLTLSLQDKGWRIVEMR